MKKTESCYTGHSIKQGNIVTCPELKKMKWTGNIRELRNVLERLIILSDKGIELEDIKKYVPAVI